MDMTWGSEPLANQILLGVVITLSLYLFFSLRLEIRKRDANSTAEIHEALTRLAALESRLEAMQTRPDLPAVPELVEATPATIRPGMNLNKRTQVLRMLRRGDSVEQIAIQLELPKSEVTLLMKVHQITVNHTT
jgi:DNA-binding NarL/FixJ family response regulator